MASRLLALTLGLSALAAAARATDADVDCTGVQAIGPQCASAETGYRRDFFYVGGETVATATGNNITANQLYVEKLSPLGGATHPNPLVFFHGGGFSGTTWLNTADNRPGFASYFVGQGHQVYLVDFNSVGRSAAVDPATFPAAAITSVEGLETGFTAVGELGAYPQARLHTQWPGTGKRGDAAFEQFRREPLPYTSNTTALETAVRRSGCALLALLGPSYVVNHSMGGVAGILLSNDCPEHVAANVNLESSTVPFSWPNPGLGSTRTRAWGLTSTPLDYDPPVADAAADLVVVAVGNETLARRSCYRQAEPARQLPRIAAVPYLLVTGEASVHITFDHCIIAYLEQVGARPEWIKLADRGIKGNGHFMHVELNNLEIAKVVQDWMESRGN